MLSARQLLLPDATLVVVACSLPSLLPCQFVQADATVASETVVSKSSVYDNSHNKLRMPLLLVFSFFSSVSAISAPCQKKC